MGDHKEDDGAMSPNEHEAGDTERVWLSIHILPTVSGIYRARHRHTPEPFICVHEGQDVYHPPEQIVPLYLKYDSAKKAWFTTYGLELRTMYDRLDKWMRARDGWHPLETPITFETSCFEYLSGECEKSS